MSAPAFDVQVECAGKSDGACVEEFEAFNLAQRREQRAIRMNGKQRQVPRQLDLRPIFRGGEDGERAGQADGLGLGLELAFEMQAFDNEIDGRLVFRVFDRFHLPGIADERVVLLGGEQDGVGVLFEDLIQMLGGDPEFFSRRLGARGEGGEEGESKGDDETGK